HRRSTRAFGCRSGRPAHRVACRMNPVPGARGNCRATVRSERTRVCRLWPADIGTLAERAADGRQINGPQGRARDRLRARAAAGYSLPVSGPCVLRIGVSASADPAATLSADRADRSAIAIPRQLDSSAYVRGGPRAYRADTAPAPATRCPVL